MSVWQKSSLGEVINLKRGHDLPNRERVNGSVPIYSSSGITGFHNEKISNGPGVITGRYGTIGKVFYSPTEYWPLNTTLYVEDFKANNELFVYYLLQQLDWEKYSDKSAVPGVNRNDVHQETVSIPSIEEQIAIASVLSSLDDKIDLLHRQNNTLERMAETLFKQWFVEEAQDSNVGQFIDLQNGYAFKSQDFRDTGVHRVLKIKNISGGIIDVNNTDFLDALVTNKTDAKFKVVTGDILFAMTGAEIGKLGIVPKTNTPLWLNQRVGLLKEKYSGARFLAYLQLNSEIGQDYIENSATGSAQPNISGSLIEQCPFPKVEASRIKKCAEILDVYYQKLISNLGQIQTLEKLRENLLPKLMSGEVRVVND